MCGAVGDDDDDDVVGGGGVSGWVGGWDWEAGGGDVRGVWRGGTWRRRCVGGAMRKAHT